MFGKCWFKIFRGVYVLVLFLLTLTVYVYGMRCLKDNVMGVRFFFSFLEARIWGLMHGMHACTV